MAFSATTVSATRRILPLLAVALLFQACSKPAKVVLYEQRQQMAQRGVRDKPAPAPPSRPVAQAPLERQVIAPPASRRAPSRGAIEVSALPPPPGAKPDRVTAADAASPSPTPKPPAAGPGTQVAVNAGPSAGTARANAKVAQAKPADAADQYRKMPPDGLHVVTPKQTVYALSRLYGVPVRSLIQLNGLEPPYLLQTGQKVRIPMQRTHVVSAGETVYAISRRYDVSLTELVRLNEIAKPFTIVTGQTLLLPDAQRTAVATAAPETPEAAGDADEPETDAQVATAPPPPAKRVVLPPSTNIPQPKRLSRNGFMWPVKGRVISRFGGKGKGLRNDGINIAAPAGAPIRAAQNGVVAYRGNELRGFGNLILIKHDKGYMTAYAHASKILVKRGARVKRGDIIARVGRTGSVGDYQLHFEIRRGRQPIDPMRYLRSDRAELGGEAAPPKG